LGARAMCLKVQIEIVGLREGEAQAVAEEIEATVPLEFHFEGANESRPSVTLSISEPKAGCGCSLLRRRGTWKAPFWNFKKPVLPHLASAVARLHDNSRRVSSFQGAWLGPAGPKDSEVSVSLPELLQRIRESKIKPGAKYVISTGA
ncbi:MAG TPA: hypothetical protein VNM68_02415, partial [Candidatus Polarisedimenticolia bacterium]|nr:hypothetical protein [Candidatus Polarisedimenticolia bacterium]